MNRCIIATTHARRTSPALRLVHLQALLDILCTFSDGSLDASLRLLLAARRRVARQRTMLRLRAEVCLSDACDMGLDYLSWDALHAEDFDGDIVAVWQGILDGLQLLLVHLVHVHRQAADRIEATVTALTFEVLGSLVRDEDLEVVEVALAVVAPWSLKHFVDVRCATLGFTFAHVAVGRNWFFARVTGRLNVDRWSVM